MTAMMKAHKATVPRLYRKARQHDAQMGDVRNSSGADPRFLRPDASCAVKYLVKYVIDVIHLHFRCKCIYWHTKKACKTKRVIKCGSEGLNTSLEKSVNGIGMQ
jgi:hypothetical protein